MASTIRAASAPPGDDYEHSDADAPDAPPIVPGSNARSGPAPSHLPNVPRLHRLGALIEPALDRAERRRTGEERPVPVPFRSYSDILAGGFWPGVHTLISTTGVGKSAFMFQVAHHAAQQQIPVLYIGLELSEFQVALRAVSEPAGVAWSRLYTGQCTVADIERARSVAPALIGFPFYVEFGEAHGWAPSQLTALVEAIRRQHPSGPMLVVLDFLQLVGAESVAFTSMPDVREKIARASYASVHVANRYGASVVLVSSAARDKYSLLASDAAQAGLATVTPPGKLEPIKIITNPQLLLGIGKESGEIEFSAESQTVLIRWPRPLESGERAVIAAVPKLRYGRESWLALRFWHRFDELLIKTIDELPQGEKTAKDGRPAVPPADLEDRVLATLRRIGPVKRRRDIVDNTEGEDRKLYAAIKSCIRAGRVLVADDGTLAAAQTAGAAGATQQ